MGYVTGFRQPARGWVNLERDEVVRVLIGDQQEFPARTDGKVPGGSAPGAFMPNENQGTLLPIDGVLRDAVMTAV